MYSLFWCSLALTVFFFLSTHSFKWTGDDVTALLSVGSTTKPTSDSNFIVLQRLILFKNTNQDLKAGHVCLCLYLEAGVGARVAEVVESPGFRRGVYRFPLEVGGHAISPRKLEYSHGDGTLLPGYTEKQEDGWLNRRKSNSEERNRWVFVRPSYHHAIIRWRWRW